jgi:putative ABC transport system permease protein
MIKDYLKLSYISFKNRGLRSWLTIFGILIGIAAVISLIGLGEGLRFAVMSQFNFLNTDIITVQASGLGNGPPGEGVVTPLNEKHVKDIEGVNGVETTIGRIIENSKIEFNEKAEFTFSSSIPSGEKRKEIEKILTLEAEDGRLLLDKDKNKIVLGNNYKKADRFGKAIKVRDSVLVQDKEFNVEGILKKKGNFIIDNAIFMNENDLKDLFSINDTFDVIVVKVPNRNDIPIVKERIVNYLRRERDVKKGEEDFTVETLEQGLKNLDSTLFAIQMFIYVIAGISIIVGGIGISNTMFTSVIERTKQIGIMKSIGAKNKDIFQLFLIESGLLGFMGGLLGIGFGVGIAYSLALLGKIFLGSDLISVKISLLLVVSALLFSFVVGTIAGVIPALKASNLKPVEALRYVK